jgi:hypothetical protein
MIVDVILPCLNEAAALPWILDRMPAGSARSLSTTAPRTGRGWSRGRSARRSCPSRPGGFGAAAQAGLLAATADLVCFCDCDGSLDPRQFPLLVRPLLAGQADLVLGRRRTQRRDAWPLPARLANWELARRVRRRTGGLDWYALRPVKPTDGPLTPHVRASDAASLTAPSPGAPPARQTPAANAGGRISGTALTPNPQRSGPTVLIRCSGGRRRPTGYASRSGRNRTLAGGSGDLVCPPVGPTLGP